jgi:hypothetical protein|tara:strand:- start:97 stop:489 length:393 start_codon:yes stop_codon:yes gene_type:complete
MDKTLLNEFKSWFSQYHKEKRKNWYGEKCDVLFFQASKGFEILLKQTERAIDTKIDKEISSKKKDRATVTKAIRVSKNKDSEHMYIELRFRDMWDEATEEIFEPYVTSAMQSIIKAQDSFENKTLEDGAF